MNKIKENFKIRIFQPIIQEYRVALYEGLRDVYGDRMELWASPNRGEEVSLPIRDMRCDYSHVMRKFGPFVWQCGLTLHGLERGDVVVVCGDLHHLSTLWLALKAKCIGIKVVWWGHHKSAGAKERNVKIRLWFAKKLSDVMLCYTDEGIGFLKQMGFDGDRIFATGNTLDLDSVRMSTEGWNGERIFEDKKTLLFCGVLRFKAQLEVLLRAIKRLSDIRNDFHCVIIGAGETERADKALANELGISSFLTWVGEVRGQQNLAPWFLSSDLFVYPGSIGLSLIHAFSFGLPVILNDNKHGHGPEYVTFIPGENGWMFKQGDDSDLAEKIEKALLSGDLQTRGEAGRQLVFREYSMASMVKRFAEALECAGRG